MASLTELLKGLDYDFLTPIRELEISAIAYDSRKVTVGSLFVCVVGYISDGHDYALKAYKQGAQVIVIASDHQDRIRESHSELFSEGGATIIATSDTRKALALIGANFYGRPCEQLNLYGITGTKGKTTVTYMLRQILTSAGRSTALIGTVATIVGDKTTLAERTTPESLDLQRILAEVVDCGQRDCVMEVSSQGLMLERVYGCHFTAGAFTNLYHDHIGQHEHANMEEYLEAKLLLFAASGLGVINADLEITPRLKQQAEAFGPVLTYGLHSEADVKAESICLTKRGKRVGNVFQLKSPWYNGEVFVALPGEFNVYNALCAITIAGTQGISFSAVKEGLAEVFVPGRLQPVEHKGNFQVYVDYAHNSASLESLLVTLRKETKGRLITVFGCGGDRAKSRRYEMGEVSGRLSDVSVITTDNPRSEEPMQIIEDILQGIVEKGALVEVEPDREKAIALALSLAKPEDCIIIAGKGHENYQIFKDKTIHFDDAEVAAQHLQQMGLL